MGVFIHTAISQAVPSATTEKTEAQQFIAGIQANTPGVQYEKRVLEISNLIEAGKLETALLKTDEVLDSYPDSRITHLMKADILRAMNGDLATIADGIDHKSKEFADFQHELNNRSTRYFSKDKSADYSELFPASILDMGQDSLMLLAEMSTGRFFVVENDQGRPKVIYDYYMTIGKAGFGKQYEGDNKTPLGLYNVTHEIAGSSLPDLYGSGAFPVDYPNKIDKWRKRTGYGIWLHGTPSDTYSRAPLASEGCFVLSNEDYDHVAPMIRSVERPRVLLVDTVNWLTEEEFDQHKQSYIEVLANWANDWESLDVDRYVRHYSEKNFNLGKGDYAKWEQRKRNIASSKEFVQLAIDINGFFLYPGEKDMFVVDFDQSYMSNNYQSKSEKQQYWKKSSVGKWQIIYEG